MNKSGASGRLASELRHVEPVIISLKVKELLMRSHLGDPAVIHDHDQIRIADRREPMCDDQARPIFHQAEHGVLDMLFRPCVYARGGLVEDQDPRK